MNHLRITKESLKIYEGIYRVLIQRTNQQNKITHSKKVINTCVFKQKVVPLRTICITTSQPS